MPIYEYICNDCKTKREFIKSLFIVENPNSEYYYETCPHCHGIMERILVNKKTAFKLKGSCWAKDSYSGDKNG